MLHIPYDKGSYKLMQSKLKAALKGFRETVRTSRWSLQNQLRTAKGGLRLMKLPYHALYSGWTLLTQYLQQITILSTIYLVAIHLPIYLAATHLTLSTDLNSFKELSFGVWGYGWDGWRYLEIALKGYDFPSQAFFPLYPLLLRGLDYFLPLTLAYRFNLLLLPILLAVLFKFCD